MSDETITESERDLATKDQSEPSFPNCWSGDDRELITETINGIEFRMRSITVGEEQMIADELGIEITESDLAKAEALGRGEEYVVKATYKLANELLRMKLNIGASLGMFKKIGNEGWSDKREVNRDNVEMLKGDVVSRLWLRYVKSFRTI